MGIGGGILLIAIGAILAYALHVDITFIDLRVTGWVFILTGITVEIITVWYLRNRQQRVGNRPSDISILEETRIAHGHALVDPEPIGSHLRPPQEP